MKLMIAQIFAFRLIIEFASKNQLPLILESSNGLKLDAGSDKYHSVQEYEDEVITLLWSGDILANTDGVDYKDTHVGDIGLIKYNQANGGIIILLCIVKFPMIHWKI